MSTTLRVADKPWRTSPAGAANRSGIRAPVVHGSSVNSTDLGMRVIRGRVRNCRPTQDLPIPRRGRQASYFAGGARNTRWPDFWSAVNGKPLQPWLKQGPRHPSERMIEFYV